MKINKITLLSLFLLFNLCAQPPTPEQIAACSEEGPSVITARGIVSGDIVFPEEGRRCSYEEPSQNAGYHYVIVGRCTAHYPNTTYHPSNVLACYESDNGDRREERDRPRRVL